MTRTQERQPYPVAVIWNENDYVARVHVWACADVKRDEKKMHRAAILVEDPSVEKIVYELLDAIVDEGGGDWTDYEGIVQVAPCVHLPREMEEAVS